MEDSVSTDGGEGVVWGWFKCNAFIMHFICNLMLPLIWQEEPAHGREVGGPWTRGQKEEALPITSHPKGARMGADSLSFQVVKLWVPGEFLKES